MRNIFSFFKKENKKSIDVGSITEKQLYKNIEVIKSLRDCDEGKKDISTSSIQKHLPRIRVASR